VRAAVTRHSNLASRDASNPHRLPPAIMSARAAQIGLVDNTRRTTTICSFVPYSGIFAVWFRANAARRRTFASCSKNGELPH
jgi:hypothetical protein